MFCRKCGAENADGTKFCIYCGEAMATPVAAEPTAAEPGEGAYTTPVQPDEAFDLNMEGNEPEQKQNRKLPKAAILAVAGILLVAAIVILLMLPVTRGFITRTFQSPEKLMYTVYSDAVEDAIDQAATFTGAADQQAFTAKSDTHLILGDQVVSLLATALRTDSEDLKAFSDIGLSCTVDSQDELKKLALSLSLSDTEILSAEQYIDLENQQMYILLPELQKQALMMDMGGELSSEQLAMLEALVDMEFDHELLKTLLLRYMKEYFEAFDSVEKTSKTLQLQGVTQKVTLLEVSLTEKSQYEAILNILERLKTDEDAKEFVESLASVIGEDCYSQFQDALDDAISETQSEIDNLTQNDGCVLKTYLNSSNDIVGLEISYREAEEEIVGISYAFLRNGRDLALKFAVSDKIVLEGSGVYRDGVNGSLTLWVEDTELMEIQIEGLDKEYDALSGNIKLVPSKETLEGVMEAAGVDGAFGQLGSFLDIYLDITLGSHETGKFVEISLMAGQSAMVKLTHSTLEHKSAAITLPESYVDGNDEAQLEQWVETLQTESLDKIMDKMEEAGVSQQLLMIALLLLQS